MKIFQMDRLLCRIRPEGKIPSEQAVSVRTMQLAWPVILESFLAAFVSMMDTVLVSVLGASAIAAAALTIQPRLFVITGFLSLNLAVSAAISRKIREGDRDGANRLLFQMLLVVLALSVALSVLCVVFANPILRAVGSNADTHRDGVLYFQTVMGCMWLNVVSLLINAAQRGAGNSRMAVRTSAISNVVNILFHYLLIGGKCGFPALGVHGAAIATVIGAAVACGLSVFSLFQKKSPLRVYDVREIELEIFPLETVFRTSARPIAGQLLQRAGLLLVAVLAASFGTEAFAAHQITLNFMAISFSFGDGLSVAALSLTGESLQKRRTDLAQVYGAVCRRIGGVFSLALALIFLLFGREFFRLYTGNEAVLADGVSMMRMLAPIVLLEMLQTVFSGCLRGAGDLRFPAAVSLAGTAFVRPLLAWVFASCVGMGILGVWVGLAADQAIRFLLFGLRYRKKLGISASGVS